MESAPRWFQRALAVPFTDSTVEVHGTDIHYLPWGERGRRGLVDHSDLHPRESS